MARPRYVVRTGTVEHWAHSVDYPMPEGFERDLEGGKSWFRAMRDMATLDDGETVVSQYQLRLVLIERTRRSDGEYKEVELDEWTSKKF